MAEIQDSEVFQHAQVGSPQEFGMSQGSSRKSFGRVAGVLNYSKEDIGNLVALVEEVRPVGKNGWNKVARKYNTLSHQSRQADCLRRKFLALFATKNMSHKQETLISEVYDRAKRVYDEIMSGRGNVDIENGYSESDEDGDAYEHGIMNIHPYGGLGEEGKDNGHAAVLSLDSSAAHTHRIPDVGNARRPSVSGGDLHRELVATTKKQQESFANMTNLMSSILSQGCHQHNELISALNAQHQSLQHQYQQLFDLQSQQNAKLTNFLHLLIKSLEKDGADMSALSKLVDNFGNDTHDDPLGKKRRIDEV